MSDWSLIGGQGIKVEQAGADASDSGKITITSGVSVHTKSAYVEIIASTANDWDCMILNHNSIQAVAGMIIDIAVGGAGSEEIIVKDFLINNYGNDRRGTFAPIPIHVKKGSRLAIRTQSNAASRTADFQLIGVVASLSSPTSGSLARSIGVNTGTTKGAIIDPGATINTKGAYVELIASTVEDIRSFFLTVQANLNPTTQQTNFLFDVAVGSAGNEEIIIPDFALISTATEMIINAVTYWPMAIPAGSRVSVRSQCLNNNATDRLTDVAILGVI